MRSNSSLLQTELISNARQLPFRSDRVYVTLKYLNFASTSSWEIIIINHLVNKVKIHARGNKFVSSAIFDQLWTSSIKPLGMVPFFTADSGLLSLDYYSTGKFFTPSCCLWIKQWIFSAVFPRLLNQLQIKSITYHLRTTYYSEVPLFSALILQYKLLSLVQ